METYQGALLIVGVCGIVLLILAVKRHSHLILNLVYRGVAGTITIFFLNQLMQLTGFSVVIGLNPGTVLTSTILGFPGVILLFGIKIYGLL
ncbi:MAG: pro-sigmaK processing inhibitor BofA family protein [Lachnospiraceae bacterium]|nr:pro-sigmaK processing inhibitor BofA family protein [Lachnospiraceae bacterium]MCI7596365.1 pro-sigmaK processing inhibitor BofA family protein [Lachnospiraceae bacterium]MDY3222000.1 pro-sigmaK processing inhibitor BofA family protein [Lachnospiraceae bacterium]